MFKNVLVVIFIFMLGFGVESAFACDTCGCSVSCNKAAKMTVEQSKSSCKRCRVLKRLRKRGRCLRCKKFFRKGKKVKCGVV